MICQEKQENFYEKAVVKPVIACFHFIAREESRFYFLQFMNKPMRYISRKALQNEKVKKEELLQFYYNQKNMQRKLWELFEDLKFMKQCDAYGAFTYFKRKMGYEEYVREMAGNDIDKREEYELDFKELESRMKEHDQIGQFLDSVEQYQKYWDMEEENRMKNKNTKKEGEEKGNLFLMTYHASKGLEFDTVFLPSLQKGEVPHKKAVTKEELEQERRMFYVAMTRAKSQLYLSYMEKENEEEKSIFIKEITE